MRQQPDLLRSLLDRLIDHEPEKPAEPVQKRLATLSAVGDSVRRDLESLLNTRRYIGPLPPAPCDALRGSTLGYGAGDFSSRNPRSQTVQQQIRLEIESLLLQFEPRLKNVTVRLDTSAQRERSLHFRIDAVLLAEPVAAPVTFATCFDINSGAFSVLK